VAERLRIFSAKIYKVGIIRYADVPVEVSRALKAAEAYVPVRGTVEGFPLITTLVSRGNGMHRVAIHGDIRKKLRVDVGACVEIALERDDEPREPVLPPALILALRQSPKAGARFRGMSVALRRQIVRYLTAVKQQTTLERRVEGFVRRLEQMAVEKKSKRKRSQ
jgi:Bacteriocin-protection, YdeI or OmpD-Associated/Domain of unknown function (DUF1905)